MRKFAIRRSKSDKPDIKSPLISVPLKSPTAIVPPKKVIRALFDFNPDPVNVPGALKFSQGDFLHVIGRENDTEWYEACNPVLGSRGLVPVNHFEDIAKTVRTSASYGPAGREQSFTGHDSGYAERGGERGSTRSNSNGAPRLSKSMPRSTGAVVYGVVLYDFKAERVDEMDAKAGEGVIVVAQTNQEWFVAKPVARLGGPGLIPVSYIEVHDAETHKPVPNANEAVARAGVPSVEEWKRSVAQYKNSTIPLGRLEPNLTNGANGLHHHMERLSVGSNVRQSQDINGNARANGNNHHYGPPPVQYTHARASQTICPVRAKVPRYTHRNEEYFFIVEAVMEDAKYWELVRHYKEFYQMQCDLMIAFPEIAGKVEGIRRTLPLMPGPLPWVTERITSERRVHLDKYLQALLTVSRDVTSSQIVRAFFTPREGDREMESDADTNGFRMSSTSHQSHQSSLQPSGDSVNGSSLGAGNSQQRLSQQSANSYNQKPSSGYQNPSDLRVPNGNVAMPAARLNNGLMAPPPLNTAASFASLSNGGASTMKIKVWFAEANCVVIRMPHVFSYLELMAKLRDRWVLESIAGGGSVEGGYRPFGVEYKDEATQQYWRLTNEEELACARERNEKLTLRVGLAEAML